MVRNLNSYDKYIRKHRKRHSYTIALRALFEGKDNNPAHEEFFNSLISGQYNQKGYYLRNRKKGKCSCCNSSQDDESVSETCLLT
jgi:hypothetical protein